MIAFKECSLSQCLYLGPKSVFLCIAPQDLFLSQDVIWLRFYNMLYSFNPEIILKITSHTPYLLYDPKKPTKTYLVENPFTYIFFYILQSRYYRVYT